MAGVQVRLAALGTSEDYVTGKLWRLASLAQCPWHPRGGCGFCLHGYYERVKPPGTLTRRWRCPRMRGTVSALPDCLAAHYSGTLEAIEATVSAVEQARSLAAAVEGLRTDIELPGAVRYLTRLRRAVHKSLDIVRGLIPLRLVGLQPSVHEFATVLGAGSVLSGLREHVARYLPQLPTPLGFNPRRMSVEPYPEPFQH
ncbi:MAG: hypothetical protein ACR2RL_22955 [Gammaproteobacteria bacterium]